MMSTREERKATAWFEEKKEQERRAQQESDGSILGTMLGGLIGGLLKLTMPIIKLGFILLVILLILNAIS